MARVGWLGLGAMGQPMAHRLLEAGHTVAAFDPMPAAQRQCDADELSGHPPNLATRLFRLQDAYSARLFRASRHFVKNSW